MRKLYLKKLWKTILFALGYILTAFCCAFLSYLLIFSILPIQKIIPETVLDVILGLLALVILLVVLYRARCSNKPYKREYLEGIEYKPLSFGKDFLQTLKSKDNIAHTLAFLTLNFLFSLPIGINAAPTIWRFLFGMLTQLIVEGTVFTLANTLLWCLVHRRWTNFIRYAGYVTDRFEK